MINKKLKVAIIGGGADSEIGKIHISCLLIDNLWEISSAVFSKNKKINTQSKKKYHLNDTKIYKNYKVLLKNEKKNLDLVVILTPVFEHYKIIKEVIKFKIPILCEKAVFSSLKEFKKIEKKIKNYPLISVHNYSSFLGIKQIRNDFKKIGKLNKIIVNYSLDSFVQKNKIKPKKWRLKDFSLIPTLFLDLGPHIFHLIYFVTNLKPEKVLAVSANYGKYKNIVDDSIILCKFNNFKYGSIHLSKTEPGENKGLSVKFVGSKSSVQWSNFRPDEYLEKNISRQKKIIDRSLFNSKMTKKYSRFKPGHIEGFLDGFSNFYFDLYNWLKKIKTKDFDFYNYNSTKIIKDELTFLTSVVHSYKKNKWIKIKY